MKEFILSYRKTIITHLIAFVLGGVIAYFIFTDTDYTEIENKTLELEKVKGKIELGNESLIPEIDLIYNLKLKNAEIESLNKKLSQLLTENKKLKNEKISNVVNYSDAELELFITEWAKRNGRLPQ